MLQTFMANKYYLPEMLKSKKENEKKQLSIFYFYYKLKCTKFLRFGASPNLKRHITFRINHAFKMKPYLKVLYFGYKLKNVVRFQGI